MSSLHFARLGMASSSCVAASLVVLAGCGATEETPVASHNSPKPAADVSVDSPSLAKEISSKQPEPVAPTQSVESIDEKVVDPEPRQASAEVKKKYDDVQILSLIHI